MSVKRVIPIAVVLAAAAWTVTAARTRTTNAPQQEAQEDAAHPGPDSARVARLLAGLGQGDALVCELIADQVGNFWNDEGRSGVGRFADAGRTLLEAKDSLHGHVRDAAAIRVLTASLSSENPCARRVGAKLLGRSRITTERLTALLGDGSARVREAAAYAAGTGERKDVSATLERMLSGSGGAEAAMAAWALGSMDDTASLPALKRATRASDVRLRVAAVHALGDIDEETAVPDLERAMRDAEAAVRAEAARALGEVGDARSVSVLAPAIDDADAEVRLAATRALGELHGVERAPDQLVRAARSRDLRLREAAAHALAEIHDPATVDVMIELLTDSSRDVRLHAVQALGEMKSAKAMPALVKALKDPDAEVRRAAAEALGEVREGEG